MAAQELWRSPSVASEDRNTLAHLCHLTGRDLALAERGERGSQPMIPVINANNRFAWRSPSVASEDRNVVEWKSSNAYYNAWRSPSVASEDRNWSKSAECEQLRDCWRSPSVASEDRNSNVLGSDPTAHMPLALAERGERGSQRRCCRRRGWPDQAAGARRAWRARIATRHGTASAVSSVPWRSPSVASEDRNIATHWKQVEHDTALALAERGERGSQLSWRPPW